MKRKWPAFALMSWIVLLFCLLSLPGEAQQLQQMVDPPFTITKKETRWLEKRGFYTAGYDWTNHQVNQYLLAALEQRKKTQKVWLVGALAAGGSLVLGVVGVVGAFAASGESSAVESIFVTMSVVGFVGIWASALVTPILAIIKSSKARKFVRMAKEILQNTETRS
ncbi:MAG: hypothetical protein AAGA85_08220 [Bacteroidota bacterium]